MLPAVGEAHVRDAPTVQDSVERFAVVASARRFSAYPYPR